MISSVNMNLKLGNAESQIGPKFEQSTFNCNICSNITLKTSTSCLSHSQETCEWTDVDLEVLWVENHIWKGLSHLKVMFCYVICYVSWNSKVRCQLCKFIRASVKTLFPHWENIYFKVDSCSKNKSSCLSIGLSLVVFFHIWAHK